MSTTCKTPWHNKKGRLQFPYQMLGDLVFIWPDPPPKKLGKEGLIHLPEQLRKKYHNGIGTILSIGPGYMDLKGKYHSTPKVLQPGIQVLFDISVPWGLHCTGLDRKKYYVVLCGARDIFGIVS